MRRPAAGLLRRSLQALIPAFLVLGLLPGSAGATTLRALNIEELTSRADRIVAGRVLGVDLEEGPHRAGAVARVTLEVERALKGPAGRRLVFRTLAPSGGGDRIVSGLPGFVPGEEIVLFLYPDSRSGLTSPVGFGQGKFRILQGKGGTRAALNAFGNRGLFMDLSPAAQERLGVGKGPEPSRPGKGRARARPLEIEDLLSAIEALR